MTERSALREKLSGCPHVPLGAFPTPIDEAPRLSESLGFRLLIKRDDSTGLALGGNKVRKLEFLLGVVLEGDYDCVITTGGSQSNHARLTAAACARLCLPCFLILDRGLHAEPQGNLLLDSMFGAEIRLIESEDRAEAVREMEQLADRLMRLGRNPYIITRGGSTPVGARGYMACAMELTEQLSAMDVTTATVYLGTGSTGTHSGLLAGLQTLGADIRVEGISVSRPEAVQSAGVFDLANRAVEGLGLEVHVTRDAIHVDDRFVGTGYGHVTASGLHAIGMAAKQEALLLDPVYTGKVMAGLLAHAEEGRIDPSGPVIFLHTGGSPALFAYHQEIDQALGAPVRA